MNVVQTDLAMPCTVNKEGLNEPVLIFVFFVFISFFFTGTVHINQRFK